MRIMINALAASAGAGLTYVRNVVPHLAAADDLHTIVLLRPELRRELGSYENVSFVERQVPGGAGRRFWYEQSNLPSLIRANGMQVLISAGNFALRNSPVPQILLSGNSLYTSDDFLRDLWARRDYPLWLDTKLKAFFAKRSVHWADVTVAPSKAFAEQLRQWAGGRVVAIHHGFDRDTFFGENSPLPANIASKLQPADGVLRLLLVSHYNYYRNFETLLQALPRLRELLPDLRVKLLLTCTLRTEDNPGTFRAESAAALVSQLGIAGDVLELGAVPYRHLHHVYGASDLYVTPAYTETFAHHVVEAMASGLPVVASDLPVHHEICGSAAVYFPTFSAAELASRISTLAASVEQRQRMSGEGREQSARFSWSAHVQEILALATSLCAGS